MQNLKLKNVNKYYPIGKDTQFHALKDVNLTFSPGELVSIIGESGSGKSTLMNLLGGLDTDFTGSIELDGANIGEFSEQQLVDYHKKAVGFVFQSFNLIPHLTVLDNVALAMTLSNIDKETRLQSAIETLESVGLKDHYTKKPNQLSGGQKQRVAIARALVNNPDIIIADEPTGALDSETGEQVLTIFKEIAAKGKLVLLVTHSERVAAISTRVVEIDDGVIINDRELDNHYGSIDSSDQTRHISMKDTPKSRNLSFLSAIKLALLNMKEKFSRNVLIALGGSIGIMSIVLMLALGAGVNDYLTETMNAQVNPLISEVRMPPNPGGPEGMNLPGASNNADGPGNPIIQQAPPATIMQNIPFEEDNLEELANIAGVKKLEEGYNVFSFGGNSIKTSEEAYNYMSFTTLSSMMTVSNIATGEFPVGKQIMVTQGIADGMIEDQLLSGPEELIGEVVEVNIVINDVTLSDSFTISGIYTSGDAIGPNAIFDGIYMNYDELVALSVEQDIELQPNIVYLVADSEDMNDTIKATVKELDYQGSTTDSLAATFSQMIDIFTYILVGVAALSLIVSAIMILTVLYISVIERTQEIGVIKAIGGRRKDIRRIFVSESFLIGLFSGLVAIGSAYAIHLFGNQIVLQKFGTVIFNMKLEFALAGVMISVIISILAGFFPANAAAKLDPVEALRRE